MSTKRNILYLVHRFPYPPDKGDRIRAFHVTRFLAEHYNVSLATLADEPVSPAHVAALGRYCRRLEVVRPARIGKLFRGLSSLTTGKSVSEGMFRSPGLSSVVSNWCREVSFDAFLLSASSMASYTAIKGLADVPLYVDLVDVDSDKWSQYARSAKGFLKRLYQLEACRVRRLEGRLTQIAKAVTLVSREEADDFRRRCEEDGVSPAVTDNIHAVFNGVDLEYFQPQDGADTVELSCTFVGAMDYLPNVEAVRWFATRVWPSVRTRYPSARFLIVGRNPTTAVTQLEQTEGVTVTGAVEDVRPWLSRSTVVVAPLQIARGIQNKVLEAMAMGRPVVATPQALSGLDVDVPGDALRASDAAEWTERIAELFEDTDLRDEIGASARRYVERNHAWEATLQPLRSLLDVSVEPRGAEPKRSLEGGAMLLRAT